MSGRRRLFFALWPDPPTRKALRKVSDFVLKSCDGRAVAPANLHLTLAFVGACEAPDQRFEALQGLARDRFELRLDRLGYWPGPQILWLGPTHCPEPLARLAQELRSALTRLGIGYAEQEFRPHMTLARKVSVFPEVEVPEPVGWTVRSFALIESVTLPTGPVYRPVREFLAA